MGSELTLGRDQLCSLSISALTLLGVPGPPSTRSTWKPLPLLSLTSPGFVTLERLVWILTSKFWPSTLQWLPEGCSWWEGEARPGYVAGIILFRLGLKCKCIPKAGGLEFSPEDVLQASFLSNLPPVTSPSPSPIPFASSAQGDLTSITSKGDAQGLVAGEL